MKDSNLFSDRLVLKEYGNYRLFKIEDLLVTLLENDDLTSNSFKLLNICGWMNLSLATSSYVYNVLDISKSLASKNDNLNHLDILCSLDLDLIKHVLSYLSKASVAEEKLLELRLPKKELYLEYLERFTKFEGQLKIEETAFSCVVGGSCYSMFLKLFNLSSKILELNLELCKDLKYILVNEVKVDINRYCELVNLVIYNTKDLLDKIVVFIYSIKRLLDSPSMTNSSELKTLDYLSYSKNLVDHFNFLEDANGFLDRSFARCSENRRRNLLKSKESVLVKTPFKYNIIGNIKS